MILTQQYLKSVLNYNSDTGIFTWIKTNRRGFIGKIAGTKRNGEFAKLNFPKVS